MKRGENELHEQITKAIQSKQRGPVFQYRKTREASEDLNGEDMETEVYVKGRVKTCASRSTNGKVWAAARDGGNGASCDEGCGMSKRSKWPLHLKDKEVRSTKESGGRNRGKDRLPTRGPE